MVNTIMFFVVLGIVTACGVLILMYQAREHAAILRKKDAYLDTLDGQVKAAEKRLNALLREGKRISTLGSRSIDDADFLNKIARTAEDADMVFLVDAVHRGIYEAILSAPTDELVLNAAGKGKGIRMLENTMRKPACIFGGTE